MTAKDLVDRAKVVQDETKASTSRTKDVLNQTVAIGSETAQTLQGQTGQLGAIDENLDAIEDNLVRADKQIRYVYVLYYLHELTLKNIFETYGY